MTIWADSSQQIAARSIAAAGLPDGDPTAPARMVVGVFSPSMQSRKLLHGLVTPEEMDEAVQSCLAVACNGHEAMTMIPTGEGQVGSLMAVIAQVFAHGILYGRQTAGEH